MTLYIPLRPSEANESGRLAIASPRLDSDLLTVPVLSPLGLGRPLRPLHSLSSISMFCTREVQRFTSLVCTASLISSRPACHCSSHLFPFFWLGHSSCFKVCERSKSEALSTYASCVRSHTVNGCRQGNSI